MTAASIVQSETAKRTIFRWDSPDRRRWGIAIFLAASVTVHALCFYIFQITYPSTVALSPPPARVNFITSATEEGRVLLRWVEAEDPALAFTTQRATDAKSFALPKVAHVPSYASAEPALRELQPLEPDLRLPSSDPPGPVRVRRETPALPQLNSSTAVKFSSELAAAGTPHLPSVNFSAVGDEAPAIAEFRVAISADGVVRFCFVESSSGNAALDEQALHYLALCRFTPSAKSPATTSTLTWGTATVEWGNDVVTPPPAPEEKHAP